MVSHGWHTGIVLPAMAIHARIPDLKKRFMDASYIEFGWGDKGFYQAQKVTGELVIRAILWPSDSVLHVVSIPADPARYFASSRIEKICLTRLQYSALLAFIESSFARGQNGRLLPLQKGIYGDSQFYLAEGKYYFFNTCNKWTAKALKHAGMDINPTFVLRADRVMDYLAEQRVRAGASSSAHLGSPVCN